MLHCNTSLPSCILTFVVALTLGRDFSLLGPQLALAGPTSSPATPVVKTPNQGSFKGLYNQSSQVEAFFGIPFAEPPLGDLRFQKTQAVKPYDKDDVRDATKANKACLQSVKPVLDDSTAEDCLYLQVHRPEGTKEGDDLPVMLWIFGGAWNLGSTAQFGYPFSLIQRSVKLDKKIIHVAGEYRLGAFGFIGGSQIDEASRDGTAVPNAAYYDQREVMHWVQENIRSFGGDPTKVTLVGQSAGAQSIGAHLVANGGDNQGLFRAAILQSATLSTGVHSKITDQRPQNSYEQLLNQTKCADLACLRQVPEKKLRDASLAINMDTFDYGAPAWVPLMDGNFIPDQASKLYEQGKMANVPIITGNVLDEGTLFGAWARNTRTEKGLSDGLLVAEGLSIPSPNQLTIEPESTTFSALTPELLKLWPDDGKVGCPFRPELFDVPQGFRYFGPKSQFKRAAGMAGDRGFIAPVRALLNATVSLNRPSWAYYFAQPTPENYVLNSFKGVSHGTEVAFVYNNPSKAGRFPVPPAKAKYAGTDQLTETAEFMSAAWINFVHDLDPNGQPGGQNGQKNWPSYTESAASNNGVGQMMHIQGGNLTTIAGDFRKDQIGFFLAHADVYKL